jgi:phosphatidyl-myo-inositol dimannoside synthase
VVKAVTRKRVLLLTPACQGADGLSAYSRLCIGALTETSDLEVWSLAESVDRERPLPQGVTRFFAAGSKRRFALRGLKRIVSPPDVIFCTHLNMAPIALPMVMRGARLVVSLLGVEAWRPLRWRERIAVKRAKLLVAISQHTIEGFHASNPNLRQVPIEVCHLCLAEEEPSDGGTRGIVPPYEVPPHGESQSEQAPFALIVARMASEERYKGHDLLLEIWPEVRRHVAAAKLVIVGSGDDKSRLEAKRDALGLQGAVEFAGRVSDEELHRLYRDCRYFVMPSRHEGFGLVFLEAMRAGKPCIGAIGSASEIIEHEKTGFVFDADDRANIQAACIRLVANPDLAARMGELGRRREAEKFSRTTFRRRLTELVLQRP